MTSPPASPNVTIRPARIDDFASVSVLRHMLSRGAPARGRARPKIDTAYARAHYAGWIAEPGNWRIVAIVQGEVAGYLSLGLWSASEDASQPPTDYAFLLEIVVAPDQRRNGVGRALLAAAEAQALESGAEMIRLNVQRSNQEAFRFYIEAGYTPQEDGRTLILVKRIAPA